MSETGPRLTDEQRLVLTTKSSSIALAAGAGCGKTFVLTQRFVQELKSVTAERAVSRLTAITFTVPAAREMRDRIREACREELAKCRPDEKQKWKQIIRDLESAEIQTIHAFCSSLLRRFSVELGIDPEFQILDEADARALQRQAVSQTVEQLVSQEDSDILEMIHHYGFRTTRGYLAQLLQGRFRLEECGQAARDSDQELADYWKECLQLQHRNRLFEQFVKIVNETRLLDLLIRDSSQHPPMQARCQRIVELLRELESQQQLSIQELNELRQIAKMTGTGKRQPWDDLDIYEKIKTGFTKLRKETEGLLAQLQYNQQDLVQAACLGRRFLRVTEQVIDCYSALKRERIASDYDDLLLDTRRLLKEQPAVRDQLQHSIEFLMLDEFQDTDPVQSEIVRLICGERLHNGGLFLVGDIKQSIYRFRRADPRVFHRLREEIPKAGQLSLTHNFRSQQPVLDFVNYMFAGEFGSGYQPLTAFDQADYSPETEKIEFLFHEDGALDKPSVDQQRHLEARRIALRIRELLEDPTPRIREKNPRTGQIELRPVKLGDIAILFRAFSNLGHYEQALQEFELDYFVVGGKAFFAQQEIFDIANLCRFLGDESDEIALVGILRSPLFSWSDETLLLMGMQPGGLAEAIRNVSCPEECSPDEAMQVCKTAELLNQWRRKKDVTPISTILYEVIERTGYDAALLMENHGERKIANLQKLLNLATEFEQSSNSGLADFATRLEESIQEEVDEELAATHAESSDVIRLMTVHKAKGLEFPVVIVADLNRSQNNQSSQAVLDPELGPLVAQPEIQGMKAGHPALEMYRLREKLADQEESSRLFYVATTRAADLLILSAYLQHDAKIQGPWLKILSRYFSLTLGTPLHDPYLGQINLPGVDPMSLPKVLLHPYECKISWKQSRQQRINPGRYPEIIQTAKREPPPGICAAMTPQIQYRDYFTVSEMEQIIDQQPDSSASKPSDSQLQESNIDASSLGTLLHRALELLDVQESQSVNELCLAASRTTGIVMDEGLQSQFMMRLSAFLDNSLVDPLKHAETIEREAEFALYWEADELVSPAVINGTIDCLFCDQQGQWFLWDYKSTMSDPSDAQLISHYSFQMTIYSIAAERLLGKPVTEAALILVNEKPRKVIVPLDESGRQDLEKQITQSILSLRKFSDDSVGKRNSLTEKSL